MIKGVFDGAGEAFGRCFGSGLRHVEAEALDEAAGSFRKAAAIRPEHPVVWFVLGLVLRGLGRQDGAMVALRAALRLRPDDADTLFQWASLLIERRLAGEALAPLLRLVALRPGYPDAAFNLGNALMAVDELERAEAAYRLAVLLEPGSAAVNNNLGGAILSQCRPEAAAVSYRRAVRLEPGSAEHHKNLGVSLLTAGNFTEGAPEYEWRTRQAVWQWNRDCPGTPLWDGGPLDGKTILVHFEQGLGDTVQFIRYMAVLKAMGARTVFECQPQLKRLLATVPAIDALVAGGEPVPEADCRLPLMSLPHRCRTTVGTIPGGVPYLRADPDRVEFWGRRIAEAGRRDEFRVGIQWRAAGADRSIPLDRFARLSQLSGVRLYSLQKADRPGQWERPDEGLGIVSLPDRDGKGEDEGFVDTAAIIEGLDLIVACDSVVGHIAGAMGRPVLLALPWLGDWRWMRLPDHTPWYPATRLFRMTRRNDWDGVMARVAGEVARRAAGVP
ncbi:tetratricopeptide repeat-containing glycosyltransferase family protein [Azospirillum isscasi]|uniref:Tetratricopeptide repeat-containing glycosyltransferase family protein n=1 Tax=Azospirillum isscasi TaxID=3053926 RepID=A0ABU0WI38_9PROT|nr:tetratricopeptide repeat-containing glycosyltransferase family protein [Azospirillum isscasi]MDQ2103876.1 tetratricopeptide repeat-containing glycosyltransferase family protein [Azospirillum isscasi]